MDLKQLKYFVTIAEEGNFSAAAKKLFLSQPPLSTQIKQLETELGCLLFERCYKNLKLTEEGKLLYKQAKEILEMCRVTKEDIIEFSHYHKGTLRIGAVSSVISPFIANQLQQFCHKYPDIQLDLFESNTYELLKKLSTNIIQLAIVRTPFDTSSVECHSLSNEPLIVVGKREFLDNSNETIDWEELSRLPLITYRRWARILHSQFNELGFTPHFRCINDDARTTMSLVQYGIGVGLVPLSATEGLSDDTIISKPISDNSISSETMLVYNKFNSLSSVSKLFIDYMLNEE